MMDHEQPGSNASDSSLQLIRAAAAGDADRVQALLAASAQPAQLASACMPGIGSPLHAAALRDDAAVTQLLLDAGADVACVLPPGYQGVVTSGHEDGSDALHPQQQYYGMTPLHAAAACDAHRLVVWDMLLAPVYGPTCGAVACPAVFLQS